MFTTLKGAAQSFYSGSFYGDLARGGRGIGACFILVLTTALLLLYFLGFLLSGGYAEMHEALRQLPEKAGTLPAVTFKDGKLSIDKPVPYRFDIGAAPDELWIVVDTDYKAMSVDALEKYMRENRIFVLFTEDKMISRDVRKQTGENAGPDDELKISDFKDTQPFTISHDKWQSLADIVGRWGTTLLLGVILITMFCVLFVVNFLATLFSGLAMMVLDIVAKTNLDFSAAMRLAAAARIPISVIASLPLLVGRAPLAGATGWLLWLIYLVFAVCAVKLHSRFAAT